MIDFFGHIAYFFIALGMFLLGKGDFRGFLSQALGSFIWMVCGFYLDLTSVICWNILFMLIGVSGYFRMRKKE